jgi:dTDP-4-dehydrorhamnose reductase
MSREASLPASALELWAGVECTVNRVGEEFYDQLERNGHAQRIADLDLFAALGVRTLRYPVLWERTAPDGLDRADWSWPDARLTRLRELGIRPIVGLLHHGSGPRHTSLIDPNFPAQLAAYARAFAERYPWVDAYTPVNEPLTTARFSGLYGHWYPHGRDDATFARALINQCRATALAMRAVREINPQAQLIQTEDLGKTFSTRTLRYQADFENVRRWLSLDLLCERITREHPVWDYLTRVAGIHEAELEWFNAHPCAPDIIGINHYLTSERFIDERVERYPDRAIGGNGRHRYADVEAVRVCA